MKKEKLIQSTNKALEKEKESVELIWNDLNKGQQQKRLKNEKIKALLIRLGIIDE